MGVDDNGGNKPTAGLQVSENSMTDTPTVDGPLKQRTLASSVACIGVGLHSGVEISMTLHPAVPDTGILFNRTDVEGGALIPARWDHVVDTRLCTTLGNPDGVIVGTVEHLMAALAGCGIDNARVDIDGAEVPVMDGSSAPFVALIQQVGVVEQDAARRVIRVLKDITVEDQGVAVTLSPGECLSFDFEIDFADAAVARQQINLSVVNGSFCRDLAGARTFGFLHEVEQLRAAGLAKGGSLENAVVVSGDRVLNEEGLRFDDEFVRHKVLDAIGDLYLAGGPVVGGFRGVCSGHAANNRVLRALFADPDAWCWDTVEGDEAALAIDGGLTAGA